MLVRARFCPGGVGFKTCSASGGMECGGGFKSDTTRHLRGGRARVGVGLGLRVFSKPHDNTGTRWGEIPRGLQWVGGAACLVGVPSEPFTG